MKRLRGDVAGDGHDHDRPPDKQLQNEIYANTFLDQLKAAFKEQNQDFGMFQSIMRDFKERKIDHVQLIARVKELLKGRDDLIYGFNALLPETHKIKIGFDVEQTREPVDTFQEAISFLNKVMERFRYNEHVYEAFLKLLISSLKGYNIVDLKHRIICLFDAHQDLVEELDVFISGSKASNEQRTANKVNGEGTNSDEEDDINGKSPRKVDYKKPINEVYDVYNQGLRFCEEVKELNGSDDYTTLLKCLHGYSTGKVEKTDLLNMVSDLLGDSYLLDKFEVYLKHCENIGRFLTRSVREKLLGCGRYLSGNVEDKDEEQKYEMERAKVKCRYKEKYMTRSIQELDLSKCKRGTQSYRLLPEHYRIASAGQRSELGAQVLNDRWVSVGSRSEDYSSKHNHTNQYEEILFRCEDDKFELDMLFESVRSARKRAKKLWEKIKKAKTTLESSIHIEDHFSVLNLRCIERLYGEHGLDVLDELHKNLEVTLPIILTRLKQKKEELKQRRLEFDKIWAQLFAENHHKSKQQNSKSLSAEPSKAENKETEEQHHESLDKKQNSRSLSAEPSKAENKETEEQMQKEDELLNTAAGMPFVEGSGFCSTRIHTHITPLSMPNDQLLSC